MNGCTRTDCVHCPRHFHLSKLPFLASAGWCPQVTFPGLPLVGTAQLGVPPCPPCQENSPPPFLHGTNLRLFPLNLHWSLITCWPENVKRRHPCQDGTRCTHGCLQCGSLVRSVNHWSDQINQHHYSGGILDSTRFHDVACSQRDAFGGQLGGMFTMFFQCRGHFLGSLVQWPRLMLWLVSVFL